MLADKEISESITHDSDMGLAYLLLTIKMANGVYSNKWICEVGKDYYNPVTLATRWDTRTIGDMVFEDLDEVSLRH